MVTNPLTMGAALAALLVTFALPAEAERTALQKHVDFFDRNLDGKITVAESAEGLRALGIGSVRAWGLAVAINGGLGRMTGAPWYDALTVHTDHIHQAKHSSDTDVYDPSGHFSQYKFDQLWSRYDLDRDNTLSESELERFHRLNTEDAFGAAASRAEFGLLMELVGQTRVVRRSWWGVQTTRVLPRYRLRQLYAGTLFYHLAGEPVPF